MPDAGDADSGIADSGTDAGPVDSGTPDAGACAGSPCTPELLVAERIDPYDLAVNATKLYWLEYGLDTAGLDGEINVIAKGATCLRHDGGCVTDLNMDAFGRFRVSTLTLTPDDVCWVEGYEYGRDVFCQGLVTNTLHHLASNQPYASRITWDGADVLWATYDVDGGVLRHRPETGSEPISVAAHRPHPVNVVGLRDFWVWGEAHGGNNGFVFALPRDGGSQTVVQDALRSPNALVAVDDHRIAWDDYGAKTLWVADLSTGMASSAPLSAATDILAMATDGQALFFVTTGSAPNYADGELWRAELDGSQQRRLVPGIPITASLAVDEAYVYYIAMGTVTRLDGRIYRVPKDY